MTTLIMAIGVSLLIENIFVAQIGATRARFPISWIAESSTVSTVW